MTYHYNNISFSVFQWFTVSIVPRNLLIFYNIDSLLYIAYPIYDIRKLVKSYVDYTYRHEYSSYRKDTRSS